MNYIRGLWYASQVSAQFMSGTLWCKLSVNLLFLFFQSNNVAILSAVEWGKKLFPTPHVVLSNVEHVATSAPVKYLASKDVISKCVYKC